jgi:hypothetical protein
LTVEIVMILIGVPVGLCAGVDVEAGPLLLLVLPQAKSTVLTTPTTATWTKRRTTCGRLEVSLMVQLSSNVDRLAALTRGENRAPREVRARGAAEE